MPIQARSKAALDPWCFVTEVFERTKLLSARLEDIEHLSLPGRSGEFLQVVGVPPETMCGIPFDLSQMRQLDVKSEFGHLFRTPLTYAICIAEGLIGRICILESGQIWNLGRERDSSGRCCGGYLSASVEQYIAQLALIADLEKYSKSKGAYNRFNDSRPYSGEYLEAEKDEILFVFKEELCNIDSLALTDSNGPWSIFVEELRNFVL